MLKSNFSKLLVSLSLLSLSGCASFQPPDKPICVEINITTGACTLPVSGKQFIIDETHKFENKTWWEMRPAMLLMPASTWAAFKIWIIKLCKKTNKCDQEISSWDRTLENVDTQLNQKLP